MVIASVVMAGFLWASATCFANNKEIELKIRFTPEQMATFEQWLDEKAEYVREAHQEDRYLNISPAAVKKSSSRLVVKNLAESNIELAIGRKTYQTEVNNLEMFKKILLGIGCKGKENSAADYTTYRLPKKIKKSFLFKRDGWWDALKTLRIRFAGEKEKVCFKLRHVDPCTGETLSRDEYETTVTSGTQLLAIFKHLGIIEKAVVSKTRRIYRYQKFEIGIDTVDGLGSFVEIENIECKDDVEQGMSDIRALLKEVGITRCTVCDRGYAHMAWNKGNLFEKDLVVVE